ncbi:hypothetical protein VNO77_22921 [Canavalia gladiata]|uniref:Uncharacterized protein n=1 Tax=Canavalia gladiata TaxID=3824 RepID=A0AAN9L405_CANGL
MSMAPIKLLSGCSRLVIQKTDSGHIAGDAKTALDMHRSSTSHRGYSKKDDEPRMSLNEKQQENQELPIRCVAQHLGFARNRPIAACMTYECLLQQRSLEVEHTSISNRMIQTIGHAIETRKTTTSWCIGYPLALYFGCYSNAPSRQVMLLEWILNAGAHHQQLCLGGRHKIFHGAPLGVDDVLINDSMNGGVDISRQVEAKYLALLSKQ